MNIRSLPTKYPFTNKNGMTYEKKHVDMLIKELYKMSKDGVKVVQSVVKHMNYFNPDKDSTNLDRQMIGFAKLILRRELKRPDKKSTHFSNVVETFGKSEIEVETISSEELLEEEIIVQDFCNHVKNSCGLLAESVLHLLIEGYSKDEIRVLLKISSAKVKAQMAKIVKESKRYLNVQ